jgi:iron complex transport system ATP-binding protein
LVTHHVEEIMPVFSQVLILKNGRVLVAGAKTNVLNSKNLSGAFGSRTRLRRTAGRYTLTVAAKLRGMM